MDRVGELLTLCDGARFGCTVWCDLRGRYEVENSVGTSEFFFQKVKASTAGASILRCRKARPPVNCPVRVKVDSDNHIVSLSGSHNHMPEFNGHGKAVYTARGTWIRALRAQPRRSTTDTVLEERRKLPMEAATQIVPERHIRTAQRQCASSLPAEVSSVAELHDIIESRVHPGYTITNDGHRVESFRLQNSNGILFFTRRQLACLSSAVMLHCDATYQVVPRNFGRQLFTLHGNWRGHVGMVACALMDTATTDAYREIFRILKEETPGPVCRSYMGDYDAAMRAAVRLEFPDARINGCLFHYSQALVRKASSREVNLAVEIRTPGEILKAFLGFTALPLLPATNIREVFDSLAHEARQISPRFDALIRYIDSYWLGVIGPAELSLFRAICRTNNSVESSNAGLRRKLGAHGSVWNLMAVLCEIAQDVAIDCNIHDAGIANIRSRPSVATRSNEERIQTAWTRLDQGLINPREFIDRVKFRTGGVAMRHGLLDENPGTLSDATQVVLDWIDEQIIVHDHDYDLTPTLHAFGDHAYSALPSYYESDTDNYTDGGF